MSVLSYLNTLSSSLIFHDVNNSVAISLNNIEGKLKASDFAGDIISISEFGSYKRDTMLPRCVDNDADIDIMVVFNNERGLKPQTILDKIKKHVNEKYKRSEVHQDFPTIVLELEHIKFEIVPAIKDYFGQLYIPSKSGLNDWIATNPDNTRRMVEAANVRNNWLILPLIRLMKAWNVRNGHPFDSYDLEERISQMSFFMCSNLKDYLYTCVDNLMLPLYPRYKYDKLQSLKQIVRNARNLEQNGYPLTAENEIKKIF